MICIFLCGFSFGSDSVKTKTVYQFRIQTEILPGTARLVSKAVDHAVTMKADYILIHMNTYGGMLDAADSIRTKLLNCPITSIVYIDNNAASAGALISISCNKIYMRSGSSIGAATVVNEKAEALPDKYQSYMRSMMRATAQKRGRDPKIAEAMVDPRTHIPGVNDSGKVLTFTVDEAIKHGYCDGQAETIEEVLQKENIKDYKITVFNPSFIERIVSFLMNPAISGVLILIILGGIYFELQTPGIGVPLFAAIGAAILYFAPLYLEGLAENWEILMVIIGFVLIAVELLFIPGFGFIGIGGIICLVLGFTFSLVGNKGFDFSLTPTGDIYSSLSIVLLSMLCSIILFFILGKSIMKTSSFNRLVLQDTMHATQGYVSSDTGSSVQVGTKAIAATSLRPSGKIEVAGSFFPANAESGFIEKGKDVMVVAADGIKITVREIKN
ncbi:MAG TPA: NfeD family protein [Bacteroidia bacterium]|nr:NfeD family protein [Bacteroidia bacterium]